MMRSRVLLPAPLGPSSAQCSPACTVTATWSSSSRSPRTRSTPASRSTACGSAGAMGSVMGGSVLRIDRRALQHVHQPDPGVPDVQGRLLGGLRGVALAEGVEYRLVLVHDFPGP